MSGRKPIGDRAMTAAERKARSRSLALGGVVGHLQQAQELSAAMRYAIRGNMEVPMAVRDALDDLDLHLELAMASVPKS